MYMFINFASTFVFLLFFNWTLEPDSVFGLFWFFFVLLYAWKYGWLMPENISVVKQNHWSSFDEDEWKDFSLPRHFSSPSNLHYILPFKFRNYHLKLFLAMVFFSENKKILSAKILWEKISWPARFKKKELIILPCSFQRDISV